MSKILVAMSGGVDSSVTAYLLKNQGHECFGCTMKLYDQDELDNSNCASCREKSCCSLSDVEDARSVAFRLGMRYQVFNYKASFDEYVIRPFVDAYLNARTPNPCIECNMHLKFGKLFEQARVLGYEDIATGHYARIECEDGIYRLKKALDTTKDQSYVLYSLNQEQLSHIHFPLGDITKTEARSIAESQGFVNAKKHDSQDICFVPDGDYAAVIMNYLGLTDDNKDTWPAACLPGSFVDKEGNFIAEHRGIIHYTIGQRRGLNVPAASRLYVVNVNPQTGDVILGSNDDLFQKEVHIEAFHWIEGGNIPSEFRCKGKIRYRHTEQPATVYYHGKNKATLIFDEPQRAITPGQTAVLYDGDTVLGGGVIV